MVPPARSIKAAFHLTRFSIALGAIADIWLVTLLTRDDSGYVMTGLHAMPAWGAMAACAVVALGLCGFAAALNDALDARHDAAFHPGRPIPSGWMPPSQTIALIVGSLVIALAAASALGTWPVRIALLTSAAILFYNAVGKHVPAIGLVAVGLIYACHMLIPNVELTFTLPIWLVMTHAMACATAIYLLEDKRPRMSLRGWGGLLLGWCFWSLVFLGGPWLRTGTLLPEGVSMVDLTWPLGAVVAFALTMRWKVARSRSRLVAAEKVRRYGALWECLYAAAWLAALGMTMTAVGMLAFAALGFATVTLLKEALGARGEPMAWRVR